MATIQKQLDAELEVRGVWPLVRWRWKDFLGKIHFNNNIKSRGNYDPSGNSENHQSQPQDHQSGSGPDDVCYANESPDELRSLIESGQLPEAFARSTRTAWTGLPIDQSAVAAWEY